MMGLSRGGGDAGARGAKACVCVCGCVCVLSVCWVNARI